MSSISHGHVRNGEAPRKNKPRTVQFRDESLSGSNSNEEAYSGFRRVPVLRRRPTPHSRKTRSANRNEHTHPRPPFSVYSTGNPSRTKNPLQPVHQIMPTSLNLPKPAVSINDSLIDDESFSSSEEVSSAHSEDLVTPRELFQISSTRPNLLSRLGSQRPPSHGPKSAGEILIRPRGRPKAVAFADPKARKESRYSADESSDSLSAVLGKPLIFPPTFQDSEDEEFFSSDSDSDFDGEAERVREGVCSRWRPLLDDLADLLGGEHMYRQAHELLLYIVIIHWGMQVSVGLGLFYLVSLVTRYFAVLADAAVGLESVESMPWHEHCFH
ncbi:hypothetical protein EV356DRAFT_505800 [Viridothelium virens]|uniref:Uncharacterized protein n=1 Tax=Viridothelium virens TaxID=1048519 RepID=A0A6A6HL11_VIRVR|nr:hypothetical protein EV356DRAFT_505800 [Viridothelium virens]